MKSPRKNKCVCEFCTELVDDTYCEFCELYCKTCISLKQYTPETFIFSDPLKPDYWVIRQASAAFTGLLQWRQHQLKRELELEGYDAVIALPIVQELGGINEFIAWDWVNWAANESWINFTRDHSS